MIVRCESRPVVGTLFPAGTRLIDGVYIARGQANDGRGALPVLPA